MSTATVTVLHPASDRSVRVPARPVAQQAPPVAPPALRLTRRGRVLVRVALVLVALVLVGAGVLVLQGTASAGQDAPVAPAVSYHVVLPGETLWSIARQEAPGRDTRAAVAEIVELNALPGVGVYAGQRLALRP